MGWISELDRQNAQAHDFLIFHNGPLPLFRASIGTTQGDSIGVWLPTISRYPTLQDFPSDRWTFVCVVYDGHEVRFGMDGHLNSVTPLDRPAGLDNVGPKQVFVVTLT